MPVNRPLRSCLKMWRWVDWYFFLGFYAPHILLAAWAAWDVALGIAEELRRWPAAQRRLLGVVLLLGG